ncbi:aromatase/cyclase [Streptomyces mutabilis]|uniref:aromatase/cyclase n=1 Tax=Streptomyces mutabilis TaxID=67332 RepID=UPI000694E213|nr:SRPBCC family protein [Streptomyces mutabilis]
MAVHERAARAAHEVTVAAPAEAVHRLLADLDNWPWIFQPFVHVELLGTDGDFERIGMWTTTGDEVVHWVALRRVDDAGLRIDFRPESPAAPLETMRRTWVVEPLSERKCTVRLLHHYTLTGDDPAAREATARVIDTVAEGETAAVRAAAEMSSDAAELLLTVTDAVDIAAPEEAVYRTLYDVRAWPGILSHVARATPLQDADGLQLVEIDTVETSGGLLAMRTARVGRPPHTLAYKQLVLPPVGRSHHVRWHLAPAPGGTRVTSEQTVVIDREGIEGMLGRGKSTADATAFVRRELSAKARLLLDGVKEHLETR